MTDWGTAIRDRNDEIVKNGPARPPATFGEIWDSTWKATGLDTSVGVGKPMFDAYDEFVTRTQELTGKSVRDLARERGLPAYAGGFDGQVDLLGRIVDTLPDHQQKLLTDYRDVRARARQKAAEIEKRAEDTSGATYGLAANSVAFLSGVARQMVDPVNLAMAPIGGPAKGPVLKWLGKEFLIGAGTQAVQEPYISTRRQELGLQSDSMMNIFEAGVGQAGFSGLMRAAGAALRAGRSTWRGPEVDLSPEDFDAAARQADTEAVFDRMNHHPVDGAAQQAAARRVMNDGEPLSGMAAARSTALDLDGTQPIIRQDGTRLEARYAVVERGQLVTSHSLDGTENPAFPRELQPRDRSQGTSQIQVNDIAGKLQPERLGPSPIAQEGAPIVGQDGIVESGNGRVLAIETAYARFPDKAEAYRAYLESLGFDNVRGMKEPVLVRIRQQDLAPAERIAFARQSNVATTGSLSASERAFVDARGLHEGIMELWQGGQASDAKNAPFVRRFAGELLAPQEQKGFVDQDGRLAREGQDRIEAAVVARAYGDQGIVRELTESTDQRSKALLGAFADASPMVARLKSAVADGRVAPALDISRPLVDAFNMVDRARRTGAKLGDMLDQIDLERGAVPDATRAAVQLFYRNEALTLVASRETVAERINKAAEQAIMHQAGGFFGDELDAAAVLRAARFATENLSNMDLSRRMSEAADAGRSTRTIDDRQRWNELKMAQPFLTLEEAYKRAPDHQVKLIADMKAIGIGEVKDPGIKMRATAEEKMIRKDYNDPRQITDIVRGGVVFDRPTDADVFVKAIFSRFEGRIRDEGWLTNEVGYSDRKLILTMPDGMLAEVQLWDRVNYAAKKEGAALYAIRRAATTNDRARAGETFARELAYWKEVQAALSDEWAVVFGNAPNLARSSAKSDAASSSEIGRPSQPTSAGLTDRQPFSELSTNAAARSSDTTASRSSQSNSFDFSGNMGKASESRLAQGDAEINARVNSMLGGLDPGRQFEFAQPDGSMKKMTAAEQIEAIRAERKAANELNECIDRTGGRIETEEAA